MITEKIRDILKAYTEAFPPADEHGFHMIWYGRNGSDAHGYVDQLLLTLNLDNGPLTITIDEDDFDKPIEQIVCETRVIVFVDDLRACSEAF
jgi:hypothetical protein